MLFFTRWKAAAILLMAFVVCLFAVPNFFPERMVEALAEVGAAPRRARPRSAGRLAPPAPGRRQRGAQGLLAIAQRRRTAGAARGARSIHRPRHRRQHRGGAHHARHRRRQRAGQAARAVAAARRHARRVGQRNIDVTANGNLITLTPTEAAITERVRQAVDQSIQIIERRVNELGTVEPTIQREGIDRILVQVPGLQDPTRLKEILGKTAKLDFRMVDQSMTAEQAADSRAAAGFRASRRRGQPKHI